MFIHLITREKIYSQQRKYLLGFLVLFVCANTWIAGGDSLVALQGLTSFGLAYVAGQHSRNKKHIDVVLFIIAILVPTIAGIYLDAENLPSVFFLVIVFQVIYLVENKRTQALLVIACIISSTLCSYIHHQANIYYPAGRALSLSFFAFITSQTINYLLESQNQLQKAFRESTRIGNVLDETKAFQRSLLDGTNYAIIAVDKSGIITEFNRAASRLLEYEPEEVIGKFTPEIFHDNDEMEERTRAINQRYNAGIQKGVMTLIYKNLIGVPNSNEWVYITKSGTRLNVWLTITTLKDENGNVIGNMALAQDITAKRLYEQEQHTAATIIANSPSVLFRWAFDVNFTLMYVSTNVDRLLGYSSLDFTSLNIRYGNLILEEDFVLVFRRFNEAVKSGATTMFNELRIRHKDGNLIWVEEKLFIKRDENNVVEYIEGVITDITKNKQAQEDLMASELRYELAARGTAAGIWDWLDVSNPDLWLSPRYFELLGYQFNEIEPVIDMFRQMVHPDDRGIITSKLASHFEDNVPFIAEFRMRKKDGTYSWFSSSGHAHRNREGKAVRMVGSIIDINSRKINEELLKQSEERYRLLVEAARDIFYNTDKGGHFTYVNEAAADITEYPVAEILNMRYFDMIDAAYKEKVRSFYQNQIDTNTDVTYLEFPIVTKSGKTKWIGQNVRMVYENGTVISRQAIARDITNLKHTEQQLQRYAKSLEHTVKDLDNFFYVVSQGIKSPLRGISHITEWIRTEQEPHLTIESRENIMLLKNLVLKMELFINRLLRYANTGKNASKKTQINVRTFIEYLVELRQQNTHVNVEMDAIDLEVETESILLEQVLSNLLDNAVKFNTSENPLIKISCQKLGNKLVFSVSDNGTGIEKQYHEKIFNPFQVIELPDGTHKGGVGLAIVKKILVERNGHLSIESEPGKGSIFSFTWNIP
jgi:PAS domain S-box-containing protein